MSDDMEHIARDKSELRPEGIYIIEDELGQHIAACEVLCLGIFKAPDERVYKEAWRCGIAAQRIRNDPGGKIIASFENEQALCKVAVAAAERAKWDREHNPRIRNL